MLDPKTTKEENFKNALSELKRACVDKKHPFRYVSLASGTNENIGLRNVVLRDILNTYEFIVFTDFRSSKIEEIGENEFARLLFYHPKKQTQISILSTATIHYQDNFSKFYLDKQNDYSLKSYSTSESPGTPIDSPASAWNYDKEYFSVLKFQALKFDILQLDREGHLRISAVLEDEQWKINWLVP